MAEPLTSRAAVAAYLAADRLACLECSRRYAFLPTHLERTHGMDSVTYRARWGLPAGTPLAGTAYRAAHREKARRQVAQGDLGQGAARASVAARRTGRGRRVAWERAEHAAQARRMAQPPRYAPGEKRQDGRDADRARQYQQARRALLRGDPEPMRTYRAAYHTRTTDT